MDKKTPRALLKLGIGEGKLTVESRRETSVDDETPLFHILESYLSQERDSARWSV